MAARRGQATLEYVLVLTVIVAAIAAGANKYLAPAIEDMMSNIAECIKQASFRLPR